MGEDKKRIMIKNGLKASRNYYLDCLFFFFSPLQEITGSPAPLYQLPEAPLPILHTLFELQNLNKNGNKLCLLGPLIENKTSIKMVDEWK